MCLNHCKPGKVEKSLLISGQAVELRQVRMYHVAACNALGKLLRRLLSRLASQLWTAARAWMYMHTVRQSSTYGAGKLHLVR